MSDHIEHIQEKFPRPIALLIGKANREKGSAEQARKLVSGVIHYAGLTTLARLHATGGVPEDLAARARELLERPSPGGWVDFIGHADKALVARGRGPSLGVPLDVTPERLAFAEKLSTARGRSRRGALTVREILDLLVQFRNDLAHDRPPRELDAHGRMVVDALAELLAQLPALTRNALVVVEKTSGEADGSLNATLARLHSDGAPRGIPEVRTVSHEKQLFKDRLFLQGDSGALIPLYPFIVYNEQHVYWCNNGDFFSPDGDRYETSVAGTARKDLEALRGSWKSDGQSSARGEDDVAHGRFSGVDVSGYLSAKALGEQLVVRLTPAGANLLRQAERKSTLNGSISAQMVNDLLTRAGLLEAGEGDRKLTRRGEELAIESTSASPRGEDVRVIRWKPEVLDQLVSAAAAVAPEILKMNPGSAPDYDDVGRMTGRRALDMRLVDYIAAVTGLAKATVTRKLGAAPGQHVRNTLETYDSIEGLSRLTVRQALELDLTRVLARLTGRSERAVTQLLRASDAEAAVGEVFRR